jgi:hypothetical protein
MVPTIHALVRERADSRLIKTAAVKAGMKTLMAKRVIESDFRTDDDRGRGPGGYE